MKIDVGILPTCWNCQDEEPQRWRRSVRISMEANPKRSSRLSILDTSDQLARSSVMSIGVGG